MKSPDDSSNLPGISDLLEGGRFEEAADLSRRLANAGDTHGQLTLGWLYHVGKGVEKDLAQAKHWYRAAIASDSPRAEFYLGSVFWTESAFSEALVWFERAATRGFVPAIYQIGRMYRHGLGVPRDLERARHYVERAAREGHLFARRDLARELMKGHRGLLRVPVGLWHMVQIIRVAVRTASRNLEDDALLRL